MKKWRVGGILVIVMGMSVFAQNDVMDTIFQPSKNQDFVINIGNSKNAVGNEVFRGSSSLEASMGMVEACFQYSPSFGKDDCKGSGMKWDGKCYLLPEKNLDKSACAGELNTDRRKLTYVKATNNAPLLVRITQTLLRLTIALSVPILIFVGVKVIKSALTGGDRKESFKEVSTILIGLVVALAAVGIIRLIQSLMLRSLSGVL